MIDPNALAVLSATARSIRSGAAAGRGRRAGDPAPFLLEAVERFGRHYLHNLVGYPLETTLAAASLILGGP